MNRRTLFAVAAVVVASTACPPPPPPDEPPVVAPPGRILPAFFSDHDDPCVDSVDNDGDGVFEDVRTIALDDQGLLIRRTRRVAGTGPGTGLADEVFLRLADGLVHDEEDFSAASDLVPQRSGNTRRFFDDGRVAREFIEGGDGRFPLADRVYVYDDAGNVIAIDTTSRDASVDDSLVEFDYDDEGRLVELRTDTVKNGVEATTTRSYETGADGSTTITNITVDVAGTHILVLTFDAFGVMLFRSFDDDGDGTVNRVDVADIKDGALVAYDIDPTGDGEFTVRLDYVVDAAAETVAITTREDGVVTARRNSEFACFSAVVDRGTCEPPFVESAAFGCARVRFAPALDKARAEPIIAVQGSRFLAVGGFSSVPLGPIALTVDIVDVDGVDPSPLPFPGEFALAASIVTSDAVVLLGGIRQGNLSAQGSRVSFDGILPIQGIGTGRYASRAVQLSDGGILLLGGFDATGAPAPALLVGRGSTDLPLAPFDATLSLLSSPGQDVAVYAGGEDGQQTPTPSAAVAFVVIRGSSATGTGQLPAPLHRHTAVVRADHVLLLGGRQEDGVTANVVDLTVVDLALVVEAGPPLPLALSDVAAVALEGGRIFVAGGFDNDGEPSARTFVLDGDAWLEGPPLQIPRGDASAVVLGDGRIAVIGGSLRTGSATATVEVLEQP